MILSCLWRMCRPLTSERRRSVRTVRLEGLNSSSPGMARTKTGEKSCSSRDAVREEFLEEGGLEKRSTVVSSAARTDDLRALRCSSASMCCFFCSSDSFLASIHGCLRLSERSMDNALRGSEGVPWARSSSSLSEDRVSLEWEGPPGVSRLVN
jgi:hypothetical protein